MTNSTRSEFGPSKKKNMLAKYRSKRRKGFGSERMVKIAKDVKKSQMYMQQPNKRGNSNDNRNGGRAKAQTHQVTSKVASKEIPKTSELKENISSVEISSKARSVGKLCDPMMNNSSKSSKALASPSSRLHMLSSSQGIRSVAPTRREKRGKGKVTQDHHNCLGKALSMRGEDQSRDGKDDGLCISHQSSKKSTLNRANKIKLSKSKRNSEGCIPQGRIPISLDGVDDVYDVKSTKEREGQMERKGQMEKKLKRNVADVKSTKGREGQMERKGQMEKKLKRNVNEKKRKTNVNDVSEASGYLTSNDFMVKKKCRVYEANKVDGQNSRYVKDGISGVFMPSISEAIKGNCSIPIDDPIWSGIFKIGSKEYVPLAAHLSTKSCKNVCMLSRSLPPVVHVTKHSRLEVWPGSLGISGSTDENIGLFLFPPKMRPDENIDQLVKELMENDLALRAVMGETVMLIFPSIMLPRQYQTFQGKHYLWGLFRPRKDIVGVAEEQASDAMNPMEYAVCLENQEGFKDGTEQVEFSRVPEPNMDTEPQDPEGAKIQDAADQNLAPTLGGSNSSHNQPSMAATGPANCEQMKSSLGIPPDREFAIVAQPSPRLELMQELEREGALIAMPTMPRVTTGQGLAAAKD